MIIAVMIFDQPVLNCMDVKRDFKLWGYNVAWIGSG
jgi:hypothetical protein